MKLSWSFLLLLALIIPLSLRADDLTRPQQNLSSCLRNLKNISTSMEMYSVDHQGRYADSLGDLTPVYLGKIPNCPQAQKDTYSVSLKLTHQPEGYSFGCQGDYHLIVGVAKGGPRLTSEQGFITGLPPTSGQAILQKHRAVANKAKAFQAELSLRRAELAKLQQQYADRQQGKQDPAATVAQIDKGAASMAAPHVETLSAPPISAEEAKILSADALQHRVEFADEDIAHSATQVDVKTYILTMRKIAWLKKRLAQP